MLRKLVRKWWFWVGQSAFCLFALSVLGVYVEWKITRSRGEARRDEAVRRLDAEDPAWRAAELCAARNATLPPKDRNAAERAIQAVALIPDSFKEWSKADDWRKDLTPGVLPREEDICEFVPVYADCGPALEVARTVRHLDQGGFPLVFKEPNPLDTLLENTQRLREAASLLDMDVIVLSYQGRANQAIESAHAILSTGRGLGDEPFLVSQLVRMAIVMIAKNATERAIGWGEPTAGLAELQAAFDKEILVPRMTYGLRGERAMFYLLAQKMDDGSLWAADLADSGTGGSKSIEDRFGHFMLRKYLPAQQATMIELFDQMLAAEKLPDPARQAAYEQIELPPKGFENLLVNLLLPAWEKVAGADIRTRAVCASATVALACERYRRRTGNWPASLQAIPHDILPNVPTDPYTGTSLLYRVTDDGAVVYAVGKDLADDGGANLDPKGDLGTDIGFRLLNPDRRRQPAPEPDANPLPGEP
ncbi:MAG TPA: hypothetical protein VFG68_11800 [Fimbriiglobus sp.]|nr:hypothetical protein [Fimbriiglobus sp.]